MKTVSFEEKVMSNEKYQCIFLKSNGDYCVYYTSLNSIYYFNNLLGMKTKRANVYRKVRKLGISLVEYHLIFPHFSLHHVTCSDQSRARKIFDGL